MTTAFSICIIFSSTVPLVTIAATLFFCLRHVVDCLQLLTYFRKEIDSSGKLITSACNTALNMTLLYQCCMIAFFMLKKRHVEASVLVASLVFTTAYRIGTTSVVYDLSKIDEQFKGEKVFSEEVFEKWR